jgi:hypothetical protein
VSGEVAAACALALAGFGAASVFAQDPVRIVDPPSCQACSIGFVSVVTLRGTDEVALSQYARVVLSRGQYIVGPTYAPGVLLVFDADGLPITTFGRAGAGPGEIQGRAFRLAAGPGDSIHVVDFNRWSVFSPGDHRFIRSVTLAGVPTSIDVSPAGEWIAAMQQASSGQTHLVQAIDPADGSVRRSLMTSGAAGSARENLNAVENVRIVHADRGGVWITPINRVDVRSSNSNIRYFRDSGWFPGVAAFHPDEPFYHRPSPRVTDIRAMGDVLLIYAAVAARNWRAQPLPRADAGRERPRITNVHVSQVFEGVIEAVDMRTGRVLVRTTVEGRPRPITGSTDLIQRSRELPDGEIVIDVLRIVLQTPSPR